MPMEGVLREIGLAAARRYAHAEPALFTIENEHVALPCRAFQALDAVEGPLLVRGPPADPARLQFLTLSVASMSGSYDGND